jgi:hypothetical protein
LLGVQLNTTEKQNQKIRHAPFYFHAEKPKAFEFVGKKALNPKIPGGRLRFLLLRLPALAKSQTPAAGIA